MVRSTQKAGLSPQEIESCKGSLLREQQRLKEIETGCLGEDFNEANLRVRGAIRSREKLRQVDEALARIAEGVFGVCLGCGGNINRDRILSDPHVSRCRKCEANTGRKIW